MKKCVACGEEKEESQFRRLTGTKSHYVVRTCRECMNSHWRKYRATIKGRLSVAATKKRAFLRNRAFLIELKQSTPCTDCGVLFPHYVMEFDHAPGTKTNKVSSLVGNRAKMLRELSKCQLVCANCHRTREFFRRESNPLPRRPRQAGHISWDDVDETRIVARSRKLLTEVMERALIALSDQGVKQRKLATLFRVSKSTVQSTLYAGRA